jgi:hypothetical protein
MKKLLFSLVLLSTGCDQHFSYKDRIIADMQKDVLNTAQCATFKEQIKIAGDRYTNLVEGRDFDHNMQDSDAFGHDMQKIFEEVRAAGCERHRMRWN